MGQSNKKSFFYELGCAVRFVRQARRDVQKRWELLDVLLEVTEKLVIFLVGLYAFAYAKELGFSVFNFDFYKAFGQGVSPMTKLALVAMNIGCVIVVCMVMGALLCSPLIYLRIRFSRWVKGRERAIV